MILPNQEDLSDALSDVSDTGYMSDLENDTQSLIIDLTNGSPIRQNNITFIHYNVDSILADGRIDELTLVCQTVNIDCLVISESHLDQTIPNNLITIPGFHEPIRRDREVSGRLGGGCLVYVSNKHTFEQKHEFQADDFEHLWVDIRIDKSLYTVNVWYRPPNVDNHDQFMNVSENILSQLQTYKSDNKIIMSDFNFGNCYSKYPVLPHKPLDSRAPELFEGYGFTQLIDIPTRVTQNSSSLVDLVFVQKQDFVTIHGTLPKIADHDGTLDSFHSTRPKDQPRTRTIYEYNKINEEQLIQYIKSFDFETNAFSHPLTEQPKHIINILTGVFQKFVPSKQVEIRPNAPAWTNTYT